MIAPPDVTILPENDGQKTTALGSRREIPLTRGYSALVDPEDFQRFGHLKWTAMPTKKGSTVYARRSVWGADGKCRTILLHRAILNAPANLKVDHEDRNGLDCRRDNLRTADNSQSGANRLQNNSRSGMIGVRRRRNSWYGAVTWRGKVSYTLTFPSPVLAAMARDVLAQRLHGEYAVLNFPPPQFLPVEVAQ